MTEDQKKMMFAIEVLRNRDWIKPKDGVWKRVVTE